MVSKTKTQAEETSVNSRLQLCWFTRELCTYL